ncbi:cathepsin B-like cysteine proteinase 4 [Lycorma delicatula]|uniref:cathepsin B-like cysteine proteinase 4 n=1 Tax=Lycorma delicatula TaxID=130591 RepID=UPI003F510992
MSSPLGLTLKTNQPTKTKQGEVDRPTRPSGLVAEKSAGLYAVRNLVSINNDLSVPIWIEENKRDILPDNFDARLKWFYCKSISRIWNQGACSSCWALSVANMISDRICIQSDGILEIDISVEQLLSCCTNCSILPGCYGGDPQAALWYFYNEGLVTGGPYDSNKGCQPYSLPPCKVTSEGTLPPCPEFGYDTPPCYYNCTNPSYQKLYSEDFYTADFPPYQVRADEEEIKNEIYKNGPTVAIFKPYIDFIYYKTGIYHSTNDTNPVMWHSVKLIGWGTENDVPYWLVVNSWGSEWGENGTFRILRGFNECSFENHIITIIPKINALL